MRRRYSAKSLSYAVIFVAIALVWILPLVWMAAKTFTPTADILRSGGTLLPTHFTLANLYGVIVKWPFFRWMLNSAIVTSLAMALMVFVSILAAYSFARLRWKGRIVIFLLFLASMFVPWEINAIPLYFIMNFLGLLNTFPGVALPIAAMPIGIFLLRQFFVNFPRDLEDAARIDGCGSLRVLFQLFVPMSTPAIGALVVWVFIFGWNEFFWSMISLQGSAHLTLPIGLKAILGAQNVEYGLLFGSSFLALCPSLIVFLLLRKRIIAGISLSGAIK